MNDSQKHESEAIRSEIDETRRRMDDTMDALGDRLQPRHLLDEVLGFLRGNSPDGENRLTHMRERITHSCDTAMHSVVDNIKRNPMPALVIGAGVAWMIYSSRRRSDQYEFDYSAEDAARRYDPDMHYDRPLEYPAESGAEADWGEEKSGLAQAKDKIAEKATAAKDRVKDKLAHVGEAAKEKAGALRERAGEMTSRMRDSTREMYSRTRERVVTTADHHPLEVGLVALAAGILAGLAIPTPNAVNRSVGPTADRLRQRTRDAGREALQKGRRVAEAAVDAVKREAEAQGLTPERLREKTGAIAERVKEAGNEAMHREGLTREGETSPTGATCPPGTSPQVSDPSVARPVV
jgi:hypothetical protein